MKLRALDLFSLRNVRVYYIKVPEPDTYDTGLFGLLSAILGLSVAEAKFGRIRLYP